MFPINTTSDVVLYANYFDIAKYNIYYTTFIIMKSSQGNGITLL